MTLRADDPTARPDTSPEEPLDTESTPAVSPAPRRLQTAGEVRILILDDDVGVCDIVKKALGGNGFVIDVLSDPARIQSHLQEHATKEKEKGANKEKEKGTTKEKPEDKTYHLIILDYVIPGVPSESIFGWVRDYQPEASIIVVTGYPSIDSALNCLRARTYDYLTKPFEINHLADVVMHCLESKGLLRISEDALREALGAVIREKRKGLDLTLSQLATRTEVSLGYLSQIELGKNSASIETLYRISLGLNIKLADLFLAVQQRF